MTLPTSHLEWKYDTPNSRWTLQVDLRVNGHLTHTYNLLGPTAQLIDFLETGDDLTD